MRAFWEGGGYWMQKEGNARVKNLETVFIVFFLHRTGSVRFGFLGFRFIGLIGFLSRFDFFGFFLTPICKKAVNNSFSIHIK